MTKTHWQLQLGPDTCQHQWWMGSLRGNGERPEWQNVAMEVSVESPNLVCYFGHPKMLDFQLLDLVVSLFFWWHAWRCVWNQKALGPMQTPLPSYISTQHSFQMWALQKRKLSHFWMKTNEIRCTETCLRENEAMHPSSQALDSRKSLVALCPGGLVT